MTTADRVLFSTDYPFGQPSAAEITAFLDEFDPDDRAKVAAGNAVSLFGLDLGQDPPARTGTGDHVSG